MPWLLGFLLLRGYSLLCLVLEHMVPARLQVSLASPSALGVLVRGSWIVWKGGIVRLGWKLWSTYGLAPVRESSLHRVGLLL